MSKWPTVKLCDVAPASESKKPINDREVWLLNLDMVESGSGRIIDKIYVNQGKIGSSTIKFDERNVLYSKLRPYLNKVVLPDQTGYATSEMIPLRPDESRLIREYLAFFLRSPNFINYISSRVAGTKMPRANMNDLRAAQIPLPPISVQRRIVASLDAVSEVLRLRKAQLAELDNLVKSQFIEMFGDPELNEKGFPKVRLKDCTHINPRKSDDRRLRPGLKVSFVPMSAVSENGELFLSETRLYEEVKTGFTYFAEGDVLFAKITPCMENGKGAIALGLSSGVGFGSTEFHVLRPVHGVTNSHWIYQVLAFRKFRENAAANMTGSAGQRRVPASYLENYTISLPPLELQNRFADIARHVNASKLAIQQSLDETQRLFDSLMAEYFED